MMKNRVLLIQTGNDTGTNNGIRIKGKDIRGWREHNAYAGVFRGHDNYTIHMINGDELFLGNVLQETWYAATGGDEGIFVVPATYVEWKEKEQKDEPTEKP